MKHDQNTFVEGDIVYLTQAGHDWISRSNPGFNIPISGRAGKVIKVFNWRTKEGKALLEERRNSGKWNEHRPEDFKYVVAIYYPELVMEGHAQGVKAPEVLPLYAPGAEKKTPLFQKWNPDLWKDLLSSSQEFSVEVDDSVPRNTKAPTTAAPAPKPAPKTSKRRLKVVSRSSSR
jgi:hypothetical protein